ncbi:MAG: RNA methyltransferase [Candidatus Aminicenantales bacterium]
MTTPEPSACPVIVLVRPDNPENIGLAARAMKNTGFSELRLAGIRRLGPGARKTAVHADDILDGARFFETLEEATDDLQLVAAATAKRRKIGTAVEMNEAVERIGRLPANVRVGLLFGNERTGLTAAELRRANLIFTIPQAVRQPSYNLGAAVLLTLYSLFQAADKSGATKTQAPLPRAEQDAVIGLILAKLDAQGFLHRTNRDHVSAWVLDFFGRQAMSARDRGFLLALFDKRGRDRSFPPDGDSQEKKEI